MPKSLALAAALVPSAGEHSKFDCESVRDGRITAGVSIVGQHSLRGSATRNYSHCRQSLCLAAASVAARRAEEKMIVEGAWVLVIAVVTFTTIVAVVLLGSGKLYNPDRSRE
jgi:hypothetical protein